MKYEPYPFQRVAVEHAVEFLRTASPGQRQLYAAPTGCGKSIVELLVQQQLPGCWIVTPRDEIVAGMLDKLGTPDADPLSLRISTPIKLRNRLLTGAVAHPKYLIFDEGHHHNAETWQQLDILSGFAPAVAYTATPYRGTPRSTREFAAFWGEALWLITLKEAVEAEYVSFPTYSVLPLVDDDVVDIKSGEFDIRSLEGATLDRLGDLAEHCRRYYSTGRWDRATVFTVPSGACCVRFQQELLKRGMMCVTVSAETPRSERAAMFKLVEAGTAALLHINIVSEGVDLKLRRLVDLAPTMSPVRWVQQLGRITRPGSMQPEYVCTNRNILRHAYALDGCVPVAAVAEAERAFGPTERGHARALGLEALGRFKASTAKLLSGATLYIYSVSTVVGNAVVEYCAVVHPTMDPVWATKANTVVDGVKQWGKWCACDPPTDVRGFASLGSREPSEKQTAWWRRAAARFGLDPDQEVSRKSFQALPVLADLGLRLT